MAKRFALAGLTLFASLSGMHANAQSANLNGSNREFVTTAVPFLRISPDARAGAMGDAGIAISADPNAQYWNVGKIPFCDKKYGISATYTPWLKDLVPDIYLAYISGYGKFGKDDKQAISASLRYFSLGSIQYTTIDAQPNGSGMPREFSFDVGYSRKLSENLSTGVSLRYIHSAVASGVSYAPGANYKPGNAVSADAGVFYTKTKELDNGRSQTLNFGGVISNLGSKISYNSSRRDFIPQNLGLGAAYTSQFDEYNKFTVALDINKLLVPALNTADTNISIVSGIVNSFSKGDQIKKLQASIGLEYWYQNQFAVRAGYFYEDKTNGDRQYITCGLGVRYNVFEINASYIVPQGSGITRNPLSNTVRFSLVFQFDKLESNSGGDSDGGETPPSTEPSADTQGK